MKTQEVTPKYLSQLVQNGEVQALVQILEDTRVSERREVAEAILKHCGQEDVLSVVEKFIDSPSRFARYTASLLIVALPVEWSLMSRIIMRLADDETWQVREGAAGALEVALAENYDEVWPTIVQWASSSNPNIRRAVVLACMQKDVAGSDRLSRILGLLGRLLSDEDTYVRRNLGPFALGYLGRTYPDVVLPQLKDWAELSNAQARWNVAKAFSQSLGVRYPEDALDILNYLAADKRTKVQRAIASSLLNIAKEERELIKETIQDWKEDERRSETAARCERHLHRYLDKG